MENNTITKTSFKTIRIIYTALMLGIFIVAVAVYAFAENHLYTVDMTDVFFIIVPLVALGGAHLSNVLFNRLVDANKTSSTLDEKLAQYQTATIVRAACLEGPAFLAIAASFVTSNMVFIAIPLLLVLVMYVTFPTKEKFKTVFKLSMEEKSELDKL